MDEIKKITTDCPFCLEKITVTLVKNEGRCLNCGAPITDKTEQEKLSES